MQNFFMQTMKTDQTAWMCRVILPQGYKTFSCSTKLSMKFFMLINLKLLTMPNFLLLLIAEHENFSANKYENANNSWHFHIY